MIHRIVAWLTGQHPEFAPLLEIPPSKALRLSIHELAHCISLGLDPVGVSPRQIIDALDSIEPWPQWSNELLARAVEHQAMGLLGLERHITLAGRIQHSIRVSEVFNLRLQDGSAYGKPSYSEDLGYSILWCQHQIITGSALPIIGRIWQLTM